MRDRRWKLDVTRDQVSAHIWQGMVNRVPVPRPPLAAVSVPPWAVTSARAIVIPVPDPRDEPGRGAGIGAIEPFEDVRPVLGGDAPTGIGDGDFDIGSGRLGAHGNLPARRGVPQRIGQQTGEHLREPVPIGGQAGQFSRELGGELHATVLVAGTGGLDSRGHELVR